ncbi:PhoX family protein [Salinisphaera orenii]|uniref:PhoX family protein n=1 Tax=Salinisphaera orenii TaxID=856731 RepID=UPI000DBE293B
MTLTQDKSRREALKLLIGGPMALPLARWAGTGALAATAGCAATDTAPALADARFVGMPAPDLDAPETMARVEVGSAFDYAGPNGERTRQALTYEPFFKTGTQVPATGGGQHIAGGYLDIHGQPIIDRSVPDAPRQFFSDCPDGLSLLQPPDNVSKQSLGVTGNAVFAVVQFEYITRDQAGQSSSLQLPSPIAVLTLDQDPETGQLTLVSYAPVPTAAAHGLWITCGASRSPWNTHLSSEEYPADAFQVANDESFQSYIAHLYADPAAVDDPAKANPYLYNHIPEISVASDGTGVVTKHFCLGRISHELVCVCPDERTVLMGDDYTNGGAFVFVADRPRDLSAGTLYAGIWHQTDGRGPGGATLDWIRLGHATSDEIEHLATTLAPTDIMDVAYSAPNEAGYTRIAHGGSENWVRLKSGMDKAAAFLETHRYAALQGASLGFTKWEGTTVNATDKVAYAAMSYIHDTMTDGSTDIHVEGPTAGAVYALNLRGGKRDTNGHAIDSEWMPVDMNGIAALTGQDLAEPDALGNRANPDRVANPDNIKFSERHRVLLVSEDSALHVNNFLWAYNVDDGRVTRLLSAPAGAESTGLQAVDDVGGWTYVMSNFQHPGDWKSPLHDQVKDVLAPLIDARYDDRYAAEVGYIAGLPGDAAT